MKNKKNNELAVCGFAAVKKLEKNHPEKITRLYFTEEVAPKFGGLCKKLAKQHGIYNQKPAEELQKLCGSVHHQGVVAMIQAPEITPLDSDITDRWIANGENAVLLDRIGNANNFGAIVRSAAFFGIKNIVIPLDEAQSSITTSSYRGTALDAKKSVDFLKDAAHVNPKKPILVVLGNEEEGISNTIKRNCDELVIIPWAGMGHGIEQSCVDSLNVAQAASIIFYELSI